ncbi:unnamed protein product, partial [Rotaria sp. Silwood2]
DLAYLDLRRNEFSEHELDRIGAKFNATSRNIQLYL